MSMSVDKARVVLTLSQPRSLQAFGPPGFTAASDPMIAMLLGVFNGSELLVFLRRTMEAASILRISLQDIR
jgi:hypothetical protein